jgi:protein-L-isoaspartate O-methyltransferase
MGSPNNQASRKQDKKYWDRMAARWDDEIFNTLHHDKFRVIAGEIERSTRGARSVADYGCGTGIYLPLLSRVFEEVHGFERSRACVETARKSFRTKKNVAIHPASSAAVRRYGQFDVVLCVNVAVHPALRERAAVWRAVRSLLSSGGRLILVVPSFESATMVAAAEREAVNGGGDWAVGADADGVVTIEGMPYKHYTRQEVRDSLVSLGFSVARIRRVEYSWHSQGVRPGPKWRGKLPWDWIAVARPA